MQATKTKPGFTSPELVNINAITRFLNEVWNEGKVETIDELYDTGGSAHGLGAEHRQGPAEFKLFHQLLTSTCSDINVELKDIIAAGDRVAFRAVLYCKHNGSGKSLSVDGGGFATMKDGKIIEAHNAWNFLDLVIQLGAAPADIFPKALIESK